MELMVKMSKLCIQEEESTEYLVTRTEAVVNFQKFTYENSKIFRVFISIPVLFIIEKR